MNLPAEFGKDATISFASCPSPASAASFKSSSLEGPDEIPTST